MYCFHGEAVSYHPPALDPPLEHTAVDSCGAPFGGFGEADLGSSWLARTGRALTEALPFGVVLV